MGADYTTRSELAARTKFTWTTGTESLLNARIRSLLLVHTPRTYTLCLLLVSKWEERKYST